MRKKVERASSERSSAATSAKRQLGSVPRSLWSGTRASPRASCSGRPRAAREGVTLQPRGGAAHADRSPAPRDVDVVRERDGEPCAAVARRLGAELPAQPLERRVERIEARRGGEEASVAVVLGPPLLDPREMEEGRCELVSFGELAMLDRLPCVGPVRQIVAETQAGSSHHVEHPARPLLDRSGDRHGASVVPRNGLSRQAAGYPLPS